jgi:hypothetical protein
MRQARLGQKAKSTYLISVDGVLVDFSRDHVVDHYVQLPPMTEPVTCGYALSCTSGKTEDLSGVQYIAATKYDSPSHEK